MNGWVSARWFSTWSSSRVRSASGRGRDRPRNDAVNDPLATPEAFTRTWTPFLEAAGIEPTEPGFDNRVVTLAVLLVLETAERFRHSAPERHPGWGARISRTLAWRGLPLT